MYFIQSYIYLQELATIENTLVYVTKYYKVYHM